MARVLLLCPPGEAADLRFLLEDAGHEVAHAAEAPLPPALIAAAEQVQRFAWRVPTSAPALRRLLEAVSLARTRGALSAGRWVVCDDAASAALERRGLSGRRALPAELDATLAAVVEPGEEVLLVAEGSPPPLVETLATGARVTALGLEAAAPVEGGARAVLVRSVLAAERLAELARTGAGLPEAVVAAEPSVAEALRALGLPVAAVAERADAGGMADAALRVLSG